MCLITFFYASDFWKERLDEVTSVLWLSGGGLGAWISDEEKQGIKGKK